MLVRALLDDFAIILKARSLVVVNAKNRNSKRGAIPHTKLSFENGQTKNASKDDGFENDPARIETKRFSYKYSNTPRPSVRDITKYVEAVTQSPERVNKKGRSPMDLLECNNVGVASKSC